MCKYEKGDEVFYQSPTDGLCITGEIEVAYVENGVCMYGIHNPIHGYEAVSEIAIKYLVSGHQVTFVILNAQKAISGPF